WRANTPEDGKLLRALSTPGLLAELEAELGPYPRALEAEDDEARGRFSARLLEKKRPALLTLHLLALDHVQHDTRPFSAETFAVLERLDAVVGRLRELAERVAAGPGCGARVLAAATLHARGGFPAASFLVGLKPGWQMVSTLTGSMLAAGKGGTHGHLPDVAELRASFFLIGPGVPAGRALGLIDMRDVAPTLARRVGLSLSTADGKILLP